jgi:hypothetical protein
MGEHRRHVDDETSIGDGAACEHVVDEFLDGRARLVDVIEEELGVGP